MLYYQSSSTVIFYFLINHCYSGQMFYYFHAIIAIFVVYLSQLATTDYTLVLDC